jgi:hypothetical protein
MTLLPTVAASAGGGAPDFSMRTLAVSLAGAMHYVRRPQGIRGNRLGTPPAARFGRPVSMTVVFNDASRLFLLDAVREGVWRRSREWTSIRPCWRGAEMPRIRPRWLTSASFKPIG